MAGRVTTFAEVKARTAAEEALRLVRKRGGWISGPGGRVRGYEADGVLVELHTPFAGTAKVGHAYRCQAALDGRHLPDGTATLVVRDEWESPALVAVLDEQMRVAGVARYREGDWVHEVSAKLTGVPAFVLRDDADDLAAAVGTVNLVASRLWPAPSRAVFLGVVMATRALWSHSALLPLVLAEVAPEGLEIDAGPETALTRVCVKRFRVLRPKAFDRDGARVRVVGPRQGLPPHCADSAEAVPPELSWAALTTLARLACRRQIGAGHDGWSAPECRSGGRRWRLRPDRWRWR